MVTTLGDYGKTITKSIADIEAYLTANDLPQPSFDPSSPQVFSRTAPASVNASRIALIEAAQDLLHLALWPQQASEGLLSWPMTETAALRTLFHAGLFDALPADGTPLAIPELAATLGWTNRTAQFTRLIQRLAVSKTLLLPSPGHVSHSSISLPYRRDGGQWHAMATLFVGPAYRATARLPEALDALGEMKTPTPSNAAFNLEFGTETSMMEWLHDPAHPDLLAVQTEHMRRFFENPLFDTRHTVEGWDWAAAVGQGEKVVDVGGGTGMVSFALAEAVSGARFAVVDQAEVIGRAKVPSALEGRVQLVAGDFFRPETVPGDGDVYLMRHVLHDWPDGDASRIVKGISGKMVPGKTRLVVVDIVNRPRETGWYQGTQVTNLDVLMLQGFNGAERDVEAWEGLFKLADEKLEVVKVTTPLASAVSVMEVVKEP